MSKKSKNLILCLTVTLSWVIAQTESSSAGKGETGYDIEQKSLMVGNVTVRVSPSAVQVTDRGKNIIYLSRAPGWMLQIINPAAKTYYECKFDQFGGAMNRGVALFTGRMLTDVTYDAKPTKEADGLLRYRSDADYTKRENELKKNVKNSNGLPKVVDAWVNPSLVVPPQAITLVRRLYGLSETKGMPIRVMFLDFDNTPKIFLSTSGLVKKTFTDGDFVKRLPSYQRVNSATAVYRTQERDDAVGDMLQGLDKPWYNPKK